MQPLRLAFMGTPDFAVPALSALHQAGHNIIAVYSQPPKPAGRGQQVQLTPVHSMAEQLGLPVYTPKTLRDAEAQAQFAEHQLNVAIVAAYGLILPQVVLDAPRLGCINIHASLLPRWRGAAPIHRALLEGDDKTGITIMQMEAGLDTGPMLLREEIPITAASTASTLHDDLAALGAKLILAALDQLSEGTLQATPQPEQGVTYAAKLNKAEGLIDWQQPTEQIERKIRAFIPWPSAYFSLAGENIKILQAEIVPSEHNHAAGTLLDTKFTVACGRHALRLLKLQRAGKAPTDGASLLRGMRQLAIGTLLK